MSEWYGGVADDALALAISRAVGQFALEASLEHVCVLCNQSFVPVQEMGKRSCSMHPMIPNGPNAISATRFVAAEGTSKALVHHFACCGSYQAEPYARDMTHEFIGRFKGCTRCDHISTRQWSRLLASYESNFFVAFNNLHHDPLSHTARHWVVALPLTILQFVAALRWPNPTEEEEAHGEMDLHDIVKRILGPNAIVFDTPHAILESNRTDRLRTIRAGTRVLTFDAREAYINTQRRFGITTNILTNEMATVVTDSRQPPPPSTELPEQSIGRVLSMLGLSKHVESSSASSFAGSTLKKKKKKKQQQSSSQPKLHAHPQRDSHMPFMMLSGGFLGGGNEMENRLQRSDLYSRDADSLLSIITDHSHTLGAMRKLVKDCNNPIEAGRRYAQYLTPLATSALTGDDIFFKFAVGSWVDVTNIIPEVHHILSSPCEITRNVLSYPHPH